MKETLQVGDAVGDCAGTVAIRSHGSDEGEHVLAVDSLKVVLPNGLDEERQRAGVGEERLRCLGRFDFGEVLSDCFGQRGLRSGDRRVLDYLNANGLRFERLLALLLCRECELSVVADALPHGLAILRVAEEVGSFGMVFGLAIDDGIKRFELAVRGENWIKKWICPVRETDADFDADFHCATPVG